MSLILLALVVGCLFYLVRIVLEYRAFELEIQPRLEELEKKQGRILGQIDAETPLLEGVRERVGHQRTLREELMRQVEEAKGVLRAEKAQHQTLSIEVQKRAFRGTLARGRKLAIR